MQHHHAHVNGTDLHYVSAGAAGPPVLLVHGFPESWWAFHGLIPVLGERHRVFAVDLRGFGDSAVAGPEFDSATAADDLAALIEQLDVGPVHLVGQDISGPATFRLAAGRPELVASYTGVETGLPGYGLEQLADVTRGGAWYIGVLAAPGIPELLLAGRERAFLGQFGFSSQAVDQFARSYARDGGFGGAAGLYRSLLAEGDEIRALGSLAMPVLAVGGVSGEFTAAALRAVSADVESVILDGVGHYVALEAPERLAAALASFWASRARSSAGSSSSGD